MNEKRVKIIADYLRRHHQAYKRFMYVNQPWNYEDDDSMPLMLLEILAAL